MHNAPTPLEMLLAPDASIPPHRRRCAGARTALLSALTLTSALGLASVTPCRLAWSGPPDSPKSTWELKQRRGNELADRGQYIEAIGAWRQAYADVPLGAEGDPVREELLTAIARAERKLYEIDEDPSHLRRADELLERVEDSYVTRTGITDAADPHLAELRFEREAIAAQLGEPQSHGRVGESTTRTEQAEGPQPAETPPPPPLDPELARRQKSAEGTVVAGAVFSSLGLAALLLAPLSLLAAEIASDRAESDPILVSSSNLRGRERRRRDIARYSAWTGLGVGSAGLIILGAGLGARSKVRKEIAAQRREARLQPVVAPTFAGLGVSGRF